MKGKLLSILFIFILLVVAFSGCNEQKTSETEKIIIAPLNNIMIKVDDLPDGYTEISNSSIYEGYGGLTETPTESFIASFSNKFDPDTTDYNYTTCILYKFNSTDKVKNSYNELVLSLTVVIPAYTGAITTEKSHTKIGDESKVISMMMNDSSMFYLFFRYANIICSIYQNDDFSLLLELAKIVERKISDNLVSSSSITDEPDEYADCKEPIIQQLINNSSPGDIIIIPSGLYCENIVINKSITIIGENKETTTINGKASDDVIRIITDNVTIKNLTITNANGNWYTSGIDIRSNNNTIENNIIKNNDPNGILLYRPSSNNLIRNNQIYSNSDKGINTENGCSFNTITNNQIYNNQIGLAFGQFCISNNIENNTFLNNDNTGISLHMDNTNNIIQNNVISESFNGIDISYYSHNNVIKGNTISYVDNALQMRFDDNNIISDNTIDTVVYRAIWVSNSKNNEFFRNIIKNTKEIGIYFHSNARDNLLYQNNFIENIKNAHDEGNNIWYNANLNNGNYWSDYTGLDNDNDDIGDTPYAIEGGDNQDLYPLINPFDI